MDASPGFNQISTYRLDQEASSFITNQGLFCYKMILFSLKNASATFRRLVKRMFKECIGNTIEVYVDDMVVKSLMSEVHLEKAFRILCKHRMMLYPAKCTFGILMNKFLDSIITQRGIEECLDQIKALRDMPSPKTVCKIQRLNKRVAALS